MRMIRTKRRLLAGVALAVIAASCGGGATSTTAQTSPTSGNPKTATSPATTAQTPTSSGSETGSTELVVKACDLLTTEEVEAAIGTLTASPEYSAPPSGDPLPVYSCFYSSSDVDLQLGVFVYPDKETAKALFQTAIDSGGATRIDGPGDEAQSNQPTGDVTVRSGRIELSIDLFSSLSLDQELEIAKDLAAKAVPRLP